MRTIFPILLRYLFKEPRYGKRRHNATVAEGERITLEAKRAEKDVRNRKNNNVIKI